MSSVTFDQINVSLLNKTIYLVKKSTDATFFNSHVR